MVATIVSRFVLQPLINTVCSKGMLLVCWITCKYLKTLVHLKSWYMCIRMALSCMGILMV